MASTAGILATMAELWLDASFLILLGIMLGIPTGMSSRKWWAKWVPIPLGIGFGIINTIIIETTRFHPAPEYHLTLLPLLRVLVAIFGGYVGFGIGALLRRITKA